MLVNAEISMKTPRLYVTPMTSANIATVYGVEGMDVYNLSTHKLVCYDGSSWQNCW